MKSKKKKMKKKVLGVLSASGKKRTGRVGVIKKGFTWKVVSGLSLIDGELYTWRQKKRCTR